MATIASISSSGEQEKKEQTKVKFSAEERANFQKMSYSDRKIYNKKKRKQKKLERKLEFLDRLEEPKIFIHSGKRCILPYWHEFRCYARHRWIGKPLLPTIIDEFASFAPGAMEASIKAGRMKLNGELLCDDLHRSLKLTDVIEHKVHRHEPPVLDQPIEVLQNLAAEPIEGVYAVNKPPSIPVHPCGGYNFNSLLRMVLLPPVSFPQSIQPAHRLDKLTSGVVVFSDSPKRSAELFKEITERTVNKTYIALVPGHLASVGEEIIVDEPLWSDRAGKLLGRCDREKGKPACTAFTILAQTKGKTLVKCKPVTGRTHQIRLHLQFLGFPIIGDPLYQLQDAKDFEDNQYEYMKKKNVTSQAEYLNDPEQSFNSADCVYQKDDICSKCSEVVPDQPISTMYMCLHSALYIGNGWSFCADPPFWATEIMDEVSIREHLAVGKQGQF